MIKLTIALAATFAISLATLAEAADPGSKQMDTPPPTANVECDHYCEAFLKVLHQAHEAAHERQREAAEYFEDGDGGTRHRAVFRHIIEPAPHARRPSAAERAGRAAAARDEIE